MCSVLSATPNWFDSHQYFALWLEGIALLAIFIWDRIDASQQHKQTLAQMSIWRKQIHADRVAEIFRALRAFENFLVDSIHRNNSFGPGRDYSEFGDVGTHPHSKIFQPYLNLQE